MKQYIGKWGVEGHEDEVGELLIDGNHVEFYSRYKDFVFPGETFVGGDGQHGYKIFVNGPAAPSRNKALSYAKSYHVLYVLMQNDSFQKGNDITGIKEVTFAIPELVEWFGLPFVEYRETPQGELAVAELDYKDILLHDSNPKMEIYFESKTINESENMFSSISKIVKKEPRIRILYQDSKSVNDVIDDIECVMQFFGLLIGKVSIADDIRLTIEAKKLKSWLYINKDFSYNCRMWDAFSKPRTYHYVVFEQLSNLFSNWRVFFYDSHFSMLRRIFFAANNSREMFAEDVFVEYMRILDGYHTRISGDENTQQQLKQALKNAKDCIKKQIFTEDNKPIFEQSIKKVLPEWKYNSKNIGDISEWIASGYLGKKSLSSRLKDLDGKYHILQDNAEHIMGSKQTENQDEKNQIVELYYKSLGDTRNYYSHYKENMDGVLDLNQIFDSIRALKATILSIFFKHMKMDDDIVRRILAFDYELNWQTQVLIKDGDKPFLHPMDYFRENEEQSNA